MKKKILMGFILIAFFVPSLFIFGGCDHTHTLTKTAGVPATCVKEGNIEYYSCDCGKYFSDKNATTEIQEGTWVIDPLGHTLTKTNAVSATCEEGGNTAYYTCDCGKYFADENAETEIQAGSWVVDALGHNLTKVDAVSATCEEDGNTTYYTCTCGKYFGDEDAETEIQAGSWVIDAIGHDYQPTEWHDSAHNYVKKQTCQHDNSHIIETNYVEVSPTTLNSILNPSNLADRNWESYQFNLSAGNYDNLLVDMANKTSVGTGSASSPFVYTRIIDTLEFVGAGKDLTIMDGFGFSQGRMIVYVDSPNPDYYIYKTYEIDTLVFKNMTFTDKVFINSLINADYYQNPTIKINNIIFENVKFDMTGVTLSNGPLHIKSYNLGIDNIAIKNCEFLNCSGGTLNAIAIDVTKTDDVNITIENCKFENVGYNAIQIAGSGSCYVGKIEIKNNEIKNTGSRALRIGVLGAGGELVVENNIMINASNADGELLKCKLEEGSLVEINNNYWGAKDGATAIEGLVNDNTSGDDVLDSMPKTTIE